MNHVYIVICLKNPGTSAHWAGLLGNPVFAQKKATMAGLGQFHVRQVPTLEQAETALGELFQRDPEAGCILLSDTLVEPDPGWKPEWVATSALKALRDEFATNHYVSLVIAPQPARIPDNDLMLPLNCGMDDWISGFQLLVDRLDYFRPPVMHERPAEFDVRPIRTQNELREACKLRYRVYRVMGYLEQEFLDTACQIELNWCDTISIHFGAFLNKPPSAPQLLATTRLILTRDEDPTVVEWTRAIAGAQPQLASFVKRQQTEFAAFRL